MKIPVYSIKVPEYNMRTEPDSEKIGKKIDNLIKKHFLRKKVAIRGLSSHEHPGKSMDDLIKIIKETGHDRYNPKRSGDRYENIKNKKIDLFAIDLKITPQARIMEKLIEPFYTWPKKFGRKPIRLNIAIIYDLSKLKRVVHQYEGRTDIKRDGFVFKNPNKKSEAILGIIKF